MQTFFELLTVLGRIITIFPLLLILALYMGKRSIGQLPIFDFLVIVTLASVTGADIADPNVNHIFTAFAIVMISLLQKGVATLIIKHRKIGKWLTFEPTIVISQGVFQVQNLQRIQYSIDNVLQMLREKNIFSLEDVELAIIEANGQLSVVKTNSKSEVTLEDLHLQKKKSGIAFPFIIEGQVYEEVLAKFQLDHVWVDEQLQQHGVQNIHDVFFASISKEKDVHISLRTKENTEENSLLFH
ncbi:DUF421 domain-containing protein [Alkalihalobacillus sp. LMS39]|uniref:DUF421 domain-containing protein n=1 Tax=Alkalihalobacillus sp. LMS39 TaxID=2924032 RepID=UPI001FB27A39|nr:DUF421 domain-containing protein [Alkalihalobacillus sp. LMS39]UOE92419.1 DUF421 domain-containing protein [Alkalihalobacillus sp. LMS39]